MHSVAPDPPPLRGGGVGGSAHCRGCTVWRHFQSMARPRGVGARAPCGTRPPPPFEGGESVAVPIAAGVRVRGEAPRSWRTRIVGPAEAEEFRGRLNQVLVHLGRSVEVDCSICLEPLAPPVGHGAAGGGDQSSSGTRVLPFNHQFYAAYRSGSTRFRSLRARFARCDPPWGGVRRDAVRGASPLWARRARPVPPFWRGCARKRNQRV